MKKILLSTLLSLAASFVAFAHSPADTITTSQAGNYLEKHIVLVGKMISYKESFKEGNKTKRIFINVDKDYPNNPVQIVYFLDITEQTPDLSSYLNQKISVRGKLSEYRGKLELKINELSQIQIISTKP